MRRPGHDAPSGTSAIAAAAPSHPVERQSHEPPPSACLPVLQVAASPRGRSSLSRLPPHSARLHSDHPDLLPPLRLRRRTARRRRSELPPVPAPSGQRGLGARAGSSVILAVPGVAIRNVVADTLSGIAPGVEAPCRIDGKCAWPPSRIAS